MGARWKGWGRAAALLAALMLAGGATAEASSRICRDLEARLVAARDAAPPQARRYEQAIIDQRSQMEKAERQRERAGCRGQARGDDPESACSSLAATLERMRTNLARLEARHRQLAGTGDATRERRRILASLEAQGCRPDPSGEIARRPQREASLFERLFGETVEPRREEARPARAPERDDGERERVIVSRGGIIQIRPRWSGTFRTLCVRTCDGYFFPISYNASGDDLDRDAAACAALCPGTEVELYFHRVPSEESEQMVSRAGTAYSDLPSAFLYRQPGFRRPPGCECNPARNFSVIGGGQPAPEPAAAPAEPLPPLPFARPDPAADPETLADRAGGLDVETVRRLLAADASAGPATAERGTERRVRVVGPAFLPDPGEAIDLKAPGQNPVP